MTLKERVLAAAETLFALALEHTGRKDKQRNSDVADEDAIRDELHATKDEFFVALRLLLGSG